MEGLEQAITKITELKAGLPALASELARASEWLSRRDQVRGLEEAAQEVLKRVQAASSSEMLIQQQYLGQAGARVAFGLLTDLVNLIVSKGIPPKTLEPTEQPPFRTVLVTVGPRGVPDDLAEVNVSWLARKDGISETEVKECLIAEGYVLFTSEEFRRLVDRLGREILEGRIRLPYLLSKSKSAA